MGKKQYSWLATRVEEGRDFPQLSFDGSRESLPSTLTLNHSEEVAMPPTPAKLRRCMRG